MHRLVPALALLLLAGAAEARRPTPREALVPRAEEWARLLEGLDAPGGRLGYDQQEMSHFGRDLHVLQRVRNLFRDLRAIPRFSGALAEGLVADAAEPQELVRRAWLLTDVSAGRFVPLAEGWGVDGAEADASPVEVLDRLTARPGGALSERDRERFALLPPAAQRFVLRLCVGLEEAGPWVASAFDAGFLARAAGEDPAALYRFAAAPWNDERLGQLASLSSASFEALGRTEREPLAFGSVLWAAHLKRALEELDEAGGVGLVDPRFTSLSFRLPAGRVVVTGVRQERVTEEAVLRVDLGGDDVYEGRHAASAGPGRPVAALVDLGGNDRYDGGEEPCTMGCGLFGIGTLVDLAGDDEYLVAESGLGSAWHGTGLLLDASGSDRHEVRGRWGQGAAHVGAGLLVDASGDDRYRCGHQSQGLGSTYGAGVLLDVEGDDAYEVRDDGNVSELYLNQSVAMSQGCGYGRRADLGDGRSLGGGFGVLVDGAGDDSYHAQVWAQGAGYWWGVGILEDLGGNDRYRNGKYSLGAAAHFAIGSQVDLSGNDEYNVGNETAKNQFQGHARDGSIGVSIDGGGNDRYRFHSHCGGSADLASLAWLWDRAGDDRYERGDAPPESPNGWNDTPPMGSATEYEPFRSFRDDLPAVGLFLDSGGADSYPEGSGAANGTSWRRERKGLSFGRGLDLD